MSIRARILIVCCFLLAMTGNAAAGSPLKVVASFSILGDMVKNVGGERVQVTTLVGPDSDAHAFEPTPAAVKEVHGADLVVVNGLGFEGWLDRLIAASGYKGTVAVTSEGISSRELQEDHHEHGKTHGHNHKTQGHDHSRKAKTHGHDHHEEIDPHAWHDLKNGRIYIKNIATALSAADPAGATYYGERAAAYDKQLTDLDAWARAEFSGIPEGRRRMITSHDAFGYLGDAYGIEILSPMGLGTGNEPSAAGIKKLINQIKKEKISAIFVENVSNPKMIEQIARESGAKVGGDLYSDALSAADGPAASYLEMFRSNVAKIVATMKEGS